ncbi:MAG: hypothetical protein GW859_10835 [Sphingomonadales bacterium]|nr:hypothetical protein [Sphingomonadales bacterium]
MDMPNSLAGRILLALPSIGDLRFHRSAIAICSHDDAGAMGIGIDALVSGVTAGDLFDSIGVTGTHHRDRPVHYGGPVEMQRGFILHDSGWIDEPMLDVACNWALSASRDVLGAIADDRGPARWMLALGYAGWGQGQLEAELAANAWHVADFDDGLFYDDPAAGKWAAHFAAQGIDASRIAASGGSA